MLGRSLTETPASFVLRLLTLKVELNRTNYFNRQKTHVEMEVHRNSKLIPRCKCNNTNKFAKILYKVKIQSQILIYQSNLNQITNTFSNELTMHNHTTPIASHDPNQNRSIQYLIDCIATHY